MTIDASKTLLSLFVLPTLHYFNYLFYGSPTHIPYKLNKVQNSAARQIFQRHKHNHISPFHILLHQLPIEARIEDKISVTYYSFRLGLSLICLLSYQKIHQQGTTILHRTIESSVFLVGEQKPPDSNHSSLQLQQYEIHYLLNSDILILVINLSQH